MKAAVWVHQSFLQRLLPFVMRQRMLTAILFFTVVTSQSVWSQNAGDIFPDWTLEDSSHISVQFHADSAEHFSVLIFWATWCPFCHAFLPYFADIADEFSERGVRFYAMNAWERQHDTVVEYLRERTKNTPSIRLLLNAERIAPIVEVRAVPVLFVVNRQHEIVLRTAIGDESRELARELRKALEQELALP